VLLCQQVLQNKISHNSCFISKYFNCLKKQWVKTLGNQTLVNWLQCAGPRTMHGIKFVVAVAEWTFYVLTATCFTSTIATDEPNMWSKLDWDKLCQCWLHSFCEAIGSEIPSAASKLLLRCGISSNHGRVHAFILQYAEPDHRIFYSIAAWYQWCYWIGTLLSFFFL
jgi:hypothetical protein